MVQSLVFKVEETLFSVDYVHDHQKEGLVDKLSLLHRRLSVADRKFCLMLNFNIDQNDQVTITKINTHSALEPENWGRSLLRANGIQLLRCGEDMKIYWPVVGGVDISAFRAHSKSEDFWERGYADYGFYQYVNSWIQRDKIANLAVMIYQYAAQVPNVQVPSLYLPDVNKPWQLYRKNDLNSVVEDLQIDNPLTSVVNLWKKVFGFEIIAIDDNCYLFQSDGESLKLKVKTSYLDLVVDYMNDNYEQVVEEKKISHVKQEMEEKVKIARLIVQLADLNSKLEISDGTDEKIYLILAETITDLAKLMVN